MKQIKIAKPCHENWNTFTPTQKGAFCGKCKIDVIDFSNKSNSEIKTILDLNAGKHMCGRFKTSQISNFNSDYTIWQNQSHSTFQSKFIFALMLGFGLTLFSCSNKVDTHQLNQITNQITKITNELDTTKIKKDSLQTKLNSSSDSTKTKTNSNNTPSQIIDPIICGVDDILGEIAFIEEEKGEVEYIEPIEKIKGKIAIDKSVAPPIIMGMIAPTQIEPAQPTTKNLIIDSTNLVSTPATNAIIKATIFPNPIINKAKLKLEVSENQNYTITIFNEQGKLIQTIFNDILDKGSKSFKINLELQENGVYFINIKSENAQQSIKVIKTN